MILPGCKVTVEKHSSDVYKIVYFEADAGYAELHARENSPGIYIAKHIKDGVWRADKASKGAIKPEKGRLVAVSDSGYASAGSASNAAGPRLASSHYSSEVGESVLRNTGFDLHFTPGHRKIGGLTNFRDARKPLEKSDIHSSAILLANAMFLSRKVEGVTWIAEYGGSAVLTQAMKILADKGFKLKKHRIFLYQPKTSQTEVLSAAHSLGVTLNRKISRVSPINVVGLAGKPSATFNRIRHEDDYKFNHAMGDSIEFGATIAASAAFAGAVAGYAGINVGAIAGSVGIASATAIPAIGAFLKALSKAGPYIGHAKTLGKTIDTATEHWAPRLHNKIKSKF